MHYQLSRLVAFTESMITQNPDTQSPTVVILSFFSKMSPRLAIVFPPDSDSRFQTIRAALKWTTGLRVCHAIEGGFQHSLGMDFE